MTLSRAIRLGGIGLLVLAPLVVAGSAEVRGQERDLERPAVRAPREGVIEVDELIDQLPLPAAGGEDGTQFNILIYGRGDPEAARRRLELRLKSRIERIDRVCKLAPEQRDKLNAAGRGDIRRAFARAEELKAKYAAIGPRVDNRRQFLKEVAEYRRAVTEVDCFGDGSLYSKILPKALTAEQAAILDKSIREATAAQHLSTIRWAAGSLALWLQLTPEQRQKLENMLMTRTRAPRRFGEYDYYGLLLQMSKLPPTELQAIFNGDQLQKIKGQFAEAKRLEKLLEREGFLPEADVARVGKTQGSLPSAEPERHTEPNI